MKKALRCPLILPLALIVVSILLVLVIPVGAQNASGTSEAVYLTADEEFTTITSANAGRYQITFAASDDFQNDGNLATQLQSELFNRGVMLYAYGDYSQTRYSEILIGNTTRELSGILMEELAAKSAGSDNLFWGIAEKDGNIAFTATSAAALDRGFRDLLAFCTEDGFSVPKGAVLTFELSLEEYEEELKELENAKLNEIKAKIAAFKLSDFGDVNMETSMPLGVYGSPNSYPTKGEHPRLNVTSYMLDDIRELLKKEEFKYLADDFWNMADSGYTGVLPPAKTVTEGRKGYHNVDEKGLMKIEAMALAYLLTENEYYGYSAILAIKNYLTTFEFGYIYSDQCREIGRLILCVSEVYDWCYYLLTDADREQLKLGVVDIWSGKATGEFKGMCQSGDSFMEVGFPPSGQGVVSGHGSERQVLRDSFAAAVAFYDEDPSWYDFVAGRIHNQFVPFRNYYYQSGTYPQGINQYAAGRHSADVWSAWIMYTSCGQIEFDDSLNNIVKSFYAYELPDGSFFGTGDGTRKPSAGSFTTCAFVITGLYRDDYLYSWIYSATKSFMSANASNLELSYSHMAILLSSYFNDSDNKFDPESRYENMPTISYNGYPIGQIISRYEWENPNAAAVFMKIGERTTANHEHADAGTFQIFYKGLYSGESGLYATYGSTHFTYYHQATVAHNGLLVYNPSKYNPTINAKGEPEYPKNYWYSGGQRDPGETGNLDTWLGNATYDTGSVTSMAYAFDSRGRSDFAYLAGDISLAYPSDDVAYVGRSMLAVYTDSEELPLYFFVYDRIESTDPSFEKRFLLHVPTDPVIDEANTTATVTKDGAQLVLYTQKGAGSYTKLGGKGQTFLINGVNCAANTGSDGSEWGRIEISAPIGEVYTEFFNVIYVKDEQTEKTPVITPMETNLLIGSRIENSVILFAKELDPTRERLEFTTEGKGLVRYIITGIYAGTWKVYVDDVAVATVFSSEGENIIDFYAPAGEVDIVPGPDVPPANGGRIIYNTFGGSIPEDAPLTYEVGVPVTLPEAVVRGNDTFLGWYSDPSFADEFKITEIVGQEKGRINVYAKYKTAPFIEDYSTTTINITGMNKSQNGITYGASGKTGTRFYTETGNDGNTYLVIDKGASDPALNYTKEPKDYLNGSKKITFSFSLAKRADAPAFASNCRLRASGSSDTVSIFGTYADGTVKLGGKIAITTLSTEFTDINITVDFEASTMTAYTNDGAVIATLAFNPPSASTATTTLAWLDTLSTTFNWYMSKDAGTLLVDRICVYPGAFEPRPEVIPEGMAKINYQMNGYAKPVGAPMYYTVGETLMLPEPTDSLDEFIGWYTTPTFEDGTKITEIPNSAEGEFTVYARWRGIYMNEDFEDAGKVEYFEQQGSIGQVTLNASESKVGASAKTVTDENGNTYLVFTRGEKDPHMSSYQPIKAFAGGIKALTVQVDLALPDDGECIAASYRIRAKIDGKNADFYVFSITASGDIKMGGVVIGKLTSDFTTVSVTVSWETGMLIGYINGQRAGTASFKSDSFNLDWLASVTSSINFYSSGGGSIKLDNFISYSDAYDRDDALGNYKPIPPTNGEIRYEINGGTLPENAPTKLDPQNEIILPIPTKDADEFLGWYTSPDFSDESLIEKIPASDSEGIILYARWRGIYMNEDFEGVGEVEHIEKQATIGQITLNASESKVGASAKTVTDENGNTYLVFTRGEKDPHISSYQPLKAFAGGIKALTVQVDLALPDDGECIAASYRIRAKINGKNADFYVFSITTSGDIKMGGVVIGKLTSDFTTVSVTVSWETGMLIGYINGEKTGEAPFDFETYSLTWLASVNPVMNFYSTAGGSIKLDNFFAYADAYNRADALVGNTEPLPPVEEPEQDTIPENSGVIDYQLDGGTLSAEAPKYFDKTEGATLVVPTKKKAAFLGWYTSPDFNEDSKITAIPATDAESFTVYAKWMPLLASEDFDKLENTELVNETGSLGTVKATGKTGVTYKIENDENGGKYLSVSIAAESTIDPHLSVTTSTPITEFYGTAKAMTVSASLSLPEGERAASCSYRIRSRVDNQKLDLYIFSVNKNGEVWLGTSESGVKLATLASDTLTDISVTVSWDNATITGYVGGEYVGQIALNTETRGLDWLAGATNLMYFYFSDTAGGIIIDNLVTYTDEFNPEI